MKDSIKLLKEQTNQAESRLFADVVELDKRMDDCDCENRTPYYFHNIQPHTEHCIFCLNCGGMLDYED